MECQFFKKKISILILKFVNLNKQIVGNFPHDESGGVKCTGNEVSVIWNVSLCVCVLDVISMKLSREIIQKFHIHLIIGEFRWFTFQWNFFCRKTFEMKVIFELQLKSVYQLFALSGKRKSWTSISAAHFLFFRSWFAFTMFWKRSWLDFLFLCPDICILSTVNVTFFVTLWRRSHVICILSDEQVWT